jgi:hypothetical protein
MTNEQWFDSHKVASDFTNGQVVYLFVDGIGEVETRYDAGTGNLYDDADHHNYGLLEWWLNGPNRGANNNVLCPPGLEKD